MTTSTILRRAALGLAAALLLATASASPAAAAEPTFGFDSFSNAIDNPAHEAETRAGAHPDELVTKINLNGAQDPRDIAVDLPLGFLGSVLATPTCTFAELSSDINAGAGGCPHDTIVGHILTKPDGATAINGPLYSMVPEPGAAAEFGFVDEIAGAHVLYAGVVPTPGGYALRTTAPEITQVPLSEILINFYGVPAVRNGAVKEGAEEKPFFTMPANCNGKPLLSVAHMDSWQNPAPFLPDGEPDLADPRWVTATSESPPVSGCNQLAGLFKPTIEAKPDTNRGDSPTGLEVTLRVPHDEKVNTLATPPLKKAVVTLPEGMSVNPASANGLTGCSLAQIGVAANGQPNGEPIRCPDASKIGTAELTSPDLPGTLRGDIYVARQSENPFNSLLAIYIAINDPTTGVVVKIPGEVIADPLTGRLTTVVDNSPQFPFTELRTKFLGGQKAALRTPAVCGTYKVTSQLTPWSAPQSGPPATPATSFKITQGCVEAAAEEPNKPAFSAGTVTPTAGLYSPFALRLSREDGSQELNGLSVALPEGLIGKLAGVGECSEAQLALARSREHQGGGAAELSSPSCPASSELGTVTVGAGAGLTPYYATGHAYLSGPYKGALLSLAIVTPAVAGPYDLGNVVVRTALRVDPETAQIAAVSDPLPTVLDGIPLDIRSISLQMARREFTLNPTNCEKKTVSGVATTVLGQSAPLQNPFQVGGCKALGFKPKLQIHLQGSTKRGGTPALRATLTYPTKGAYANIAKASVALPHSEFLDQAHIKTICTRVQFAADSCPAASVYGFAKATTPLLDRPVEGPVYLRSSSNKLPDLVVALNGQIDVDLDGTIDSVNGGIRNRFEVVPDAPVTKFTLTMQGGKKGLLENSTNLCARPNRATVKFTAQNGKVDNYEPMVTNSCKNGGAKGGKARGHRHRGG